MVDAVPTPSAEGPTAAAKSALWRFACSVSVALQRGNFAMLAPTFASGPDSLAESGRLGNPLSEEPELWRCAPSTALSWASDAL